MNGLAQLVDEGYIQNVGLCNVENERYLESLYDEFDEEYQIKIKTNTIKFSLLNYHNEHISSSFSFQSNSNHKLLSTCKRLNIKLFSSAPLSSGLINGKYSKISPTGGKFIKQKKLSAFSFRNYDSYRGWKFGMDDLVAVSTLFIHTPSSLLLVVFLLSSCSPPVLLFCLLLLLFIVFLCFPALTITQSLHIICYSHIKYDRTPSLFPALISSTLLSHIPILSILTIIHIYISKGYTYYLSTSFSSSPSN